VIGVVRVAMKNDAEGDTVTVDPSMSLLTITNKGYGKRTAIDEYRVQPENGKPRSQSRGGKGRVDINLTDKNGHSVAALGVGQGMDLVVITKGGQLVRMPADDIRECGRGSQGVRVARVDEGDEVVSAAVVPGGASAGADGEAASDAAK
jgi:DNA gyrase subunit A